MTHLCYVQNSVITKCVIKRCVLLEENAGVLLGPGSREK